MEVLVNNIPACLRELPQWVCWKSVPQATGDPRKIPVCVATGATASTRDRATWTTFDAAVQAYKQHGYAGVGFVFAPGDPFCGIDLDDCLDEPGRVVWGEDILDVFQTYTEVSPSGFGLKLVFRATKPPKSPCNVDFRGHNVEVYDNRRFFALTGQVLPGQPVEVADCQHELSSLLETHGGKLQPAPAPRVAANPSDDRVQQCLRKILAMRLEDRNDGSHRLFSAACRCVEHGLSDTEALQCLRAYEQVNPFPLRRSDEQLLARVRDAERATQRGAALRPETAAAASDPTPVSVRQLLKDHPALRRPIIHGLLRRGETMNVIASPKVGKSWLVNDLALAVATGRHWLGTFETNAAEVLILDNELHSETSANRLPKVAEARGVLLEEVVDRIHVDNLRGRLKSIVGMQSYFESIEPGRFGIVILDAFYRFMPAGSDENSNADLATIYNHIDQYAERLGCSFVLIHHASKGNQSGKAVTDVGAGAGSQARATDTHLVLRPHEEDNCVVLDAAVRSWPPISPRVLRWTFPVWTPDDSLDPAALRPERPRRKPKPEEPKPEQVLWTVDAFVGDFVCDEPRESVLVLEQAMAAGLSESKAERLLRLAEAKGLVHRWNLSHRRVGFATVPEPVPEVVAAPTKREQIAQLLSDPALTTRQIAECTGATERFVRQVRKDLRRGTDGPEERNCAA